MEKFILDKDINVFFVKATSFPLGVGGAFHTLQSFMPEGGQRMFYGISRPNGNGGIMYMAAVEESFPGEGERHGCETFLIKKGIYAGELLSDWRRDENIIGRTFQKLLKEPLLDPNGYCLEMYTNEKDVKCLVPLV